MSAHPKDFRKGQYLFKEGEPSDCLYLIQKGTVSIRKVKGTGQVEIGKVYQNQVLGELSFFDRLQRSASAFAMSDVQTLQIRFDDLDKIYSQIPTYFQTIMACVAERLRKANERIQKLQRNVVDDDEGTDVVDAPADSASAVMENLDEDEKTQGGEKPES